MSVREIEFIQTEAIKPQRIGETFTSFPDANYLRAYKKRYGEIFMDCPQRLLLICSFCDEVHACMDKFGIHIREKHLDDDLKGDIDAIKTEAEILTNQASGQDSTGVEKLMISINKEDIPFLNSDADDSWNNDDKNIDSDTQSEPRSKTRKHSPRKAADPETKSDEDSWNASDDPASSSDSDNEYKPTDRKVKKIRKRKKPEPINEVKPATITNPALYCKECNRQYQRLKTFRLHIERVHERKNVPPKTDSSTKCVYCGQEFDTTDQLAAHKKTHNKARPFQCPHCPKSFDCDPSRQSHINMHLGIRPFKCSQCPRAFASEITMRNHLLRMHEILTPGPDGEISRLSCEVCGKLFVQKFQKEVHMRSHTGEKPFQCELCGKNFRTNGVLKEHMLRHNNERKYACHICGKKFFDDRMRNNHLVVHSTEKPFECQDCGKTFSRELTLKLHRKIHSDVYQYSCDICGKRFKQSSGLYSHKKTHGCVTENVSQKYGDGSSCSLEMDRMWNNNST